MRRLRRLDGLAYVIGAVLPCTENLGDWMNFLATSFAVPSVADLIQVEQTQSPSLIESLTSAPPTGATATGAGVLLVVAWLALFVTRRVLLRVVHRVTEKTTSTWDDTLRSHRVFHRLAHAAPALAIYFGIAFVPDLVPEVEVLIRRVAIAFLAVMFAAAIQGLLSAVNAIYVAEFERSASRPIKGYLQIVAIFLWIAVGIVVLSTLFDQSPIFFLSGLGALTAVLLLVFRTTILSFVATVQIASNDMVRVGDWIEMSQLGADGDVIDIALNTVKVQNWDKTITTIPTYKLVEESFRNWRGMSESGGRRIKRSLKIDMNSVRFLTDDELGRLQRLELLADYLAGKRRELGAYDGMTPDRPSELEATPRRLTNLGTFRQYILAYLQNHTGIHQEMTILVRQLAPAPDGIPLEIYCFTSDTAWGVYESVQADLFDHLLAMPETFGLRVFQNPTGADFRRL